MVRVFFYLSKKGDKVFSTPRTPYQLSRNYYKSYQEFFKWHQTLCGEKTSDKTVLQGDTLGPTMAANRRRRQGAFRHTKKLHLMAQTDTQTHRQADMATL